MTEFGYLLSLIAIFCTALSLIFALAKKKTIARIIAMLACCANLINFIWHLTLVIVGRVIYHIPDYMVSLVAGLIAFSLLSVVLAFKKKEDELSGTMNILLYISLVPMSVFVYVQQSLLGDGHWIHISLGLSYIVIWLVVYFLTASLKITKIKDLIKNKTANIDDDDNKI